MPPHHATDPLRRARAGRPRSTRGHLRGPVGPALCGAEMKPATIPRAVQRPVTVGGHRSAGLGRYDATTAVASPVTGCVATHRRPSRPSRNSVRSNDGSHPAAPNRRSRTALGIGYCHSRLATPSATESPFRSSSRRSRTRQWSVTESMTVAVTRISPAPAAAPTRAASWTPLPK